MNRGRLSESPVFICRYTLEIVNSMTEGVHGPLGSSPELSRCKIPSSYPSRSALKCALNAPGWEWTSEEE